MSLPLNLTMTSPGSIPALAAALSFCTEPTSAPAVDFKPKFCANAWLTSWMVTPRRPCSTLPCFCSWSSTCIAMSIGTANARPWKPPEWLKICEFTPMTSPFRLNSGPPELPGLTAASVWMKGTYESCGNARALALTIPAVTVFSKP